MIKEIDKWRLFWEFMRGMWRLYWGQCPGCASQLPAVMDCTVCCANTKQDKFWQDSWVLQLHHKYFTH
ncbi:hypothetical protein [Hymenobacter siberiensis]|uniref:hypothetical protein n=1 Tax=Hymenobacter siberiensis TaxID=2848396 RepID=UPI001C1E3006|nr:hypothetical protein [Hymenobacter siberiensis]